jgi:hypothetical protein
MPKVQTTLPHSWSINRWPADVYPGSPSRARYVVRVHRNELLHAGALSRVGRDLVVLGERYSRWLEKNCVNVPGYEIAANRVPPPK